jgi:hypothetical protein
MRIGSGVMLALMLLAPWTASASHYMKAEPREYSLAGASGIDVDFPSGVFTLEGDDGSTVRIDLSVRCGTGDLDDCRDRAAKVTIDHRIRDGRLILEFRGFNRTNQHEFRVTARVRVPRAMATKIEMGVGELKANSLHGDLEIELGVGELDVESDATKFRAAKLDVGVGDANLRANGGRYTGQGFIGRTVRWSEGTGASSMRLHVGVGDASVVLR